MPTAVSNILAALVIMGLLSFGLIALVDSGLGAARGWIYVLLAVAIALWFFHLV